MTRIVGVAVNGDVVQFEADASKLESDVATAAGVTSAITCTTIAASGLVTASKSGTGLSVTNNATVGGTLAVTGASTLTGNVAAGGTLAVTGASTLTGNVTASGTLAVAGASTLTGNVAAAGTLTVAGALSAPIEPVTAVTASTTQTQAAAKASALLTAGSVNVITCANNADALCLPAAAAGNVGSWLVIDLTGVTHSPKIWSYEATATTLDGVNNSAAGAGVTFTYTNRIAYLYCQAAGVWVSALYGAKIS